MFERFTKEARRVVEGAVVSAEAQDADEVRPEHLFRALLSEHGPAVQVLTGLGVGVERLYAELDQRRGRYVGGLGDDDAEALASIGIDLEEVLRSIDEPTPARGRRRRHRKFAKASKKVLECSLREAIDLGHGYIGTDHLLLGLARGGDPLVVDTLTAAGVTPLALRAAVADAVRKAG